MGFFDFIHKKQSIDENGKFKSKLSAKDKIPELDDIISQIHMNLGNNYKDEAQRELKRFTESFQDMKANDLLNDKQLLVYGQELSALTERMQGFTHKDQKPYWH